MRSCLLGVVVGLTALAVGLVALVLATGVGLLPVTRQVGPAAGSTPVVVEVVATVPLPTSPPGTVRITSLAEVERRIASLRGQSVEIVITEEELTQRVAEYIRQRGDLPVSDLRTALRTGQIVLTGKASQAFLSIDFSLTGHPVVDGGHLLMAVDRVEPSAITNLAPIKEGDRLDLPLSFDATGVQVLPGQMVVTGRVR